MTDMIAMDTIVDEIVELKTDRKAMILAHHYQDSEIQDLADAWATAWNWRARRGTSKAT